MVFVWVWAAPTGSGFFLLGMGSRGFIEELFSGKFNLLAAFLWCLVVSGLGR